MSRRFGNLSLRVKVALLGVGSALLTVVAMIALVAWQSGQYNRLAQREVDALIAADLDHITSGVYSVVRTEDEAVQRQVDGNLKVARQLLDAAGPLTFSGETDVWNATNQLTEETTTLHLPKMLLGGKPLGQNRDPVVPTPVVDDLTKLDVETATLFQRVNERGDMLRVATTVRNKWGQRAIGTFISAIVPDGTTNPVIAGIMQNGIFRGRAYVVDAWYITAYEALADRDGRVVGMLYVGIQLKHAESVLRRAIIETRVGETGYVYVLGGKGADRGRYVISQGGRRDGDDIWDSRDSDGSPVIQQIIARAVSLRPGELTTVRYRWQNPGEPAPRWKIARVAYYAPWDWVIGTSVYEDELHQYREVLSNGRSRMTSILGLAGLLIAFLFGTAGFVVAWRLVRPLRQMKRAAETIIQGELNHLVEAGSDDEIGALAKTFNVMTTRLRETLRGLSRSEEKYRSIVENALEGLFQTSLDGHLLNANPAAAHILGYDSAKELMARITDLRTQLYVYAEERDAFVAEIREQGTVLEREVQFRRKDGERIWVSISARLVRDEAGLGQYLAGFVVDVSARRQAEAEAKAATSQLESIFEFLPDATFIIDANQKIVGWNRAMEEMTGVPKAQILGQSHLQAAIPFYGRPRRYLVDLLSVDDAQLKTQYSFVKTRGDTLYAEVYTPALYDGRGAYVWAVAAPLYGSDGKVIGAIEAIRDISEHQRIEKELRDSEERYRAMYEDNPSMYFTVDLRGVVLSVNEFGARQLGYAAKDLVGTDIAQMYAAEDRDQMVSYVQRCAAELEEVHHWELRKVSKDGRLVWVKETGRAVRQRGDQTVILIVCEDISERRRAEEERDRLEDRLRQAQKLESLGLLAGGIAHDFNNLLTPILGYTELLSADLPPSNPHHEDLKMVRLAGERGRDLVRQLLAFSRRQVLEFKAVRLGEVVQCFAPMLKRVIREDVRIEMRPDSDRGIVRADVGQIEQVLMNLSVNAQDAMPWGGTLTIEIQDILLDSTYTNARPELNPGPYTLLSVSDTGSGMDAETQRHIFEPFFTTKERGKGTGLGLPTVYGIVRQHGGIVSLYSEPGLGSTFKVFLPQVMAQTNAPRLETAATNTAPETGTETILVADDDSMVRELACKVLRRLGYNVLTAEDAEGCISLVETYPGPVDLLLTDVVMPTMDGPSLYRRLRLLRPSLRVLYMSGYTSNVIVHHGTLDPGVHFVPKPLAISVLAEKVRTALRAEANEPSVVPNGQR